MCGIFGGQTFSQFETALAHSSASATGAPRSSRRRLYYPGGRRPQKDGTCETYHTISAILVEIFEQLFRAVTSGLTPSLDALGPTFSAKVLQRSLGQPSPHRVCLVHFSGQKFGGYPDRFHWQEFGSRVSQAQNASVLICFLIGLVS